jgi:hypothetical protein
MFYSKKRIFFLISLLMGAGVSYFVYNQALISSSQTKGYLYTLAIIVGVNTAASFIIAIIASLVGVKIIYWIWMYLTNGMPKRIFWKTVWFVYTAVVYIIYAVIYFGMIRY